MSWQPILAFQDESQSFVLGFEAGCVWQALKHNEDEQTFIIHGGNAELMLRIAESTKREITWAEIDNPLWANVTFGPRPEEEE